MTRESRKGVLKFKVGLGFATALVLTAGATPLAVAAPSPEATDAGSSDSTDMVVEADESRATLIEMSDDLSGYGEREVLKLLLAGEGRIAQENPALEELLGFHPERAEISPQELSSVVDAYLVMYPEFSNDLYPRLTSGDPAQFESAVVNFYESLVAFIETDPIFEEVRQEMDALSSGDPLEAGTFNNSVNVNAAINARVGINLVYVSNVMVVKVAGAVAVAALALGVAVSYLDEPGMAAGSVSGVDQEKSLRELRLALAS